MKKFTFRLNKILDLRKWREKTQQQKFAQAQVEKQVAAREHDEAVEAANNHIRESRSKTNKSFSVSDALLNHHYQEKLTRETIDRKKDLETAEEELENERATLVKRSRDRQVLEKLHERRLDEFTREFNRVEQAELDDDAGRRHYTNGNNEK